MNRPLLSLAGVATPWASEGASVFGSACGTAAASVNAVNSSSRGATSRSGANAATAWIVGGAGGTKFSSGLGWATSPHGDETGVMPGGLNVPRDGIRPENGCGDAEGMRRTGAATGVGEGDWKPPPPKPPFCEVAADGIGGSSASTRGAGADVVASAAAEGSGRTAFTNAAAGTAAAVTATVPANESAAAAAVSGTAVAAKAGHATSGTGAGLAKPPPTACRTPGAIAD
mmetsp:Transcript_147040/g.472177  ORF Transcript_147040/g.472177 Transcript_147040/m.472177 type:complete len:229 (-) Transcript_147040:800-1486(-)